MLGIFSGLGNLLVLIICQSCLYVNTTCLNVEPSGTRKVNMLKHSHSKYGLETIYGLSFCLPLSKFVYANGNNQPWYLNINKPKTTNMHGVRSVNSLALYVIY